MKPVNSTVDRSGHYFQLITGSNDDRDNDADIDDYDHVDVDNDDDASDGDVDEANNFNNNNNYNNNSNSNNEYNQKLIRGGKPVSSCSCSVSYVLDLFSSDTDVSAFPSRDPGATFFS